MNTPEYEHHFLKTNGITLHVVAAGPQDGPVVILLHGFPEYWGGWRKQIPALVEAGFRVWAPDQRGYNRSDKPAEVDDYRIETLAADILGLIDLTGREQVNLVGHDWGAAVAWWVAMEQPERLSHLAILNVPHPSVMAKTVLTDPRQTLRSTYIGFFQIPWLPEAASRAFNWAMLARTMKRSAAPGVFTDEILADYKRAWSQPGAYTAMLNWYRAAVRHAPEGWPSAIITPPTTIIWGTADFALRKAMAEPSADLCSDAELIYLDGVSHWVQHEAPSKVNSILLKRLSR